MEGQALDDCSAVFLAAKLGIVRRMDVVMPGLAFGRRLAEVVGQKGLRRGDGAFELDLNGIARRFSTPRTFVPPAEPVLVLIEPSWFVGGHRPTPSPGSPPVACGPTSPSSPSRTPGRATTSVRPRKSM